MKSVRRIREFRPLAAVTLLAVAVGTASAAGPPAGPRSLGTMIAQSELVFLGQVESISYVTSQPNRSGENSVPHTFVTYRLERLLAGEATGGSVTLRFLGGLDPVKMRIMSSSVTPQFDVGDRDILFVTGNTVRPCPLVGNQEGRLRIIDGGVYSEDGRAVRVEEGGVLRYGSRFRLPAVMTTTVEGTTFATLTPGPDALEPPGDGIDADGLAAAVAAEASRMAPRAGFTNADPSVPFAGPDAAAAPPPVR